MKKTLRSTIAALIVTFPVACFAASGIDALHAYLHTTHSMKAQFEQTVYDRNHKVTQHASGSMEFQRPGKFRWTYAKPYEQLLVGDGRKLWMYDPELNQVTERSLDKAIGSSPAALLAGRNEIEGAYVLKDAGTKGGLTWVEAIPKGADSGFKSIVLGFQGADLTHLVMQDNFGQQTDIVFSAIVRNPKVAASDFVFRPPKGADVIGQ